MKRIFFRKGKYVGLSVNFSDDDIVFITECMNNSDITKYLMRRFPTYPTEEKEWLEKIHTKTDTDQVFGISLIETGELIGMMGLHRISWVDRTATTGAYIAVDTNRGKGLGSEAKMLLLDYAFNSLMLRKISSYVLATNERSKRYNEKCGYRVEGILKQHAAVYGGYADEYVMAVFKEDFEPIWRIYKESAST